VLVLLHINLLSPKTYTFALQAEALFESVLTLQFDRAARAEDALPGDAAGAV
jgi:hypothetical protein